MGRGYLGTDMAFDKDFVATAAGDADLTGGLACLAQDLKHALTTPRGDLWYDPSYGVDIYKYLKGENTETERLAMALDIVLTIEADPRVVAGSARAEAVKWDLHSIAFKASCQPVGESNRLNMVLGYSPNAFEVGVVYMATDFKTLIGAKSFDELMDAARLAMQGGKITNWNIGGVFRTLAALSMQGVSELYALLWEKVLPNSYAATATGNWLDLIAKDVDLERHWAEKAKGFVTMTREEATGGAVVIEAGSIVKTQTTASGDELRFFTARETILPEGATSVPVPVQAEFAGAKYNVSEGAITILVTHIYGIDGIANAADWLTDEGSDDESDDSLRERYFLRWNELSTGSTALAYKSWAMRTPGVLDAAVHDLHPRGQGTVDVIITSYDGEPSEALLSEVAAYIETKRPQCSDVLVKAPTPVPVDIAAALWLPGNAGDTEATIAEAQVIIQAMFVPDESRRQIAIQKIGQPFYRARLNRWLMDIEHVFNVVITSPAGDIEVQADQLVERGNVEITVVRIDGL